MTLTEADIIGFARVWDPQPFHIDAEAARTGHFGGIIASGFQTLAVTFRMLYQAGFLSDANLGGPGMDELRWLKPVRPGDTLYARSTVKEVTPSRSKPDRGIVKFAAETRNQHGDVVMTVTFIVMVARRAAARPA
ncbi:MAG: MaoC family dehydratase [Alphaproteobacteria bacterium]|nr:MaoC family dehydratase [Alphaproteobacteria bacterium]